MGIATKALKTVATNKVVRKSVRIYMEGSRILKKTALYRIRYIEKRFKQVAGRLNLTREAERVIREIIYNQEVWRGKGYRRALNILNRLNKGTLNLKRYILDSEKKFLLESTGMWKDLNGFDLESMIDAIIETEWDSEQKNQYYHLGEEVKIGNHTLKYEDPLLKKLDEII